MRRKESRAVSVSGIVKQNRAQESGLMSELIRQRKSAEKEITELTRRAVEAMEHLAEQAGPLAAGDRSGFENRRGKNA